MAFFMSRPVVTALTVGLLFVSVVAADVAEKDRPDDTEPAHVALELPPGEQTLWKLIADCNSSYEKLTGYTCTFGKQERVDGLLRPEEIITMTFRKPLSVHLVWTNGLLKNRQVIYEVGKHKGMLLAYTGNLPAFRKVFRIHPTSVEAKRENKHSIREAGMGYLCMRLREQFEKAKAENTLEARYLGVKEFEGRRTWLVSRKMPGGGRREWHIDTELVLPIHVATYDSDGKLLERYTYTDITLNPDLKDEDFDPDKVFF